MAGDFTENSSKMRKATNKTLLLVTLQFVGMSNIIHPIANELYTFSVVLLIIYILL